jgi:hypothetical protein
LQLARQERPSSEPNRRRIAPRSVRWARVHDQSLQAIRASDREQANAFPHGVQLDQHPRVVEPLHEHVEDLLIA